MEMYNIPEPRNDENYMIGGLDTNQHMTRPFEQVEVMYNEQAPEYFVDQGLYYPTATNYGYYCTGFESSGELEDHHRFFGVDGPDIQYTGAQNENFPYVYYTPTYGYAQSPYNPYNPYIPGAFIGDDGQFVGAQAQQYFSVPQYQNVASSPAYAPVVVQPDIIPNRSPEAMFDIGSSISRSDRGGFKNNISFTSGVFQNATKSPSYQKYSLARVPEGTRNAGPIKQASFYGNVSSGSLSNPVQSHVRQGKSSSLNLPNEKVPSPYQLKVPLSGNSLSELGSSTLGRVGPGKVRPKFNGSRALDDINSSSDALGEQNRGPRTNRSKNELAVTVYTTKEGDSNAHGNIIIYTDQYNKEDFLMDYVDAKFFVIKSYSEDDVHKSIKYNVWSSTPHGNRKLNGAYADAQRRASVVQKGCPVFLFFSVNMSGQFCGVAEMIGPVDFNKDMDFWQQDKWSGSFPVKWHFIKDVPNTSLRHIILENNENKPVTNSRDTQEITYKKGLEMLKIFKNHLLKTSLLDDFMYYENRQKIMQDEKARLLVRSLQTPFLVPVLGPPRKLNHAFISPAAECVSLNNLNDDLNSSRENSDSKSVQVGSKLNIGKTIVENENSELLDITEDLSKLKIDSLTLAPKKADSKTSTACMANSSTGSFDVVTVGSVPLKINGITASSGFLTFGSVTLDPRALQVDKCGEPNKNGSKD